MCGFAIAPIIRAVIASALISQLGVDARDDDVELGEQLVLLVEGAVLEDVDLDAARGCATARAPRSAGRRGRAARGGGPGVSPCATLSRGEWSVIARYSWPSSAAVRAMRSTGEPPSDQSECMCRSPRSQARTSSPGPLGLGVLVDRVELEPLEVARGTSGEGLGARPGRWCRRSRGAPAACPAPPAGAARPDPSRG